MNFKVINIRKIEPVTGNFKLHEDYILSYDHFDGWSNRLLRLGFYIDIIFDCKVEIDFHQENQDKFEKQLECELPSEIKNMISEIMNLDHLTLKHYYADMTMEDMSHQHIVINHNNISHNIGVGILLKKPQPENPSEKLFFDLIELFEKWREEIYQECLKELTTSNQISDEKHDLRPKRR
ncbi:hypothetical protein HNP37_004246 [Flavobacterium nitrogenifigens]|uniref:Uncharacterized protein n=2 Tax=Flavobacterium TaxID=237 RepID=A0A7W7J133_9FLAO|nr:MULTISPECIES: hypothetical protein [Flavobacterium]MBB4804160.1 hypothetical protein [Flavobacterium nitrogenifigens]MBB6389119.1 hypothetical protein [Flavobacterium notoginsengisoli]